MTERAFIALGSNLGDRAAHLDRARVAISLLPTTRLEALSKVEETAPLGAMAQPPYLNQMIAVRTRIAPRALLHALHGIVYLATDSAEARFIQRHAIWAFSRSQ